MITGIHHITAIASDAKETVSFYTKMLGLRLVKKTVNQDDTSTYHLFFGDRYGHPGMDLTFFIFQPAVQGRRGSGLVTTISLAVPDASMDFWKRRFDAHSVKHDDIIERFGRKRLVFYDSDDQKLELVGLMKGEIDDKDSWTTKDISKKEAIRHFYSAELAVMSRPSVEPILTRVFGYEHISSDKYSHVYTVKDSHRANMIEIREEPSAEFGISGAGTVHHIAFRAKDEKEQAVLRDKVLQLGLYPTEVINRFYFRSVYFRTPAGILFEIATDGPGFTADEEEKDLGKKLALPPFLEHERKTIESKLPNLLF